MSRPPLDPLIQLCDAADSLLAHLETFQKAYPYGRDGYAADLLSDACDHMANVCDLLFDLEKEVTP